MTIRLHVFPLSPRAFKVLLAAHYLGIDYEMAFVNFAVNGQKTPEYTALNPNQRMPTLEHDGFVLWESNAIVQYLAALKPESGALPADIKARMTAVKWQFWEAQHWDPACAIFMFERVVKPLFGLGETSAEEIARGEALIARIGPVFDAALGSSRFLAGDTITVADLSLASTFASAEQAQFPVSEFRNMQRWLAEMQALPAWAQTKALQRPPS